MDEYPWHFSFFEVSVSIRSQRYIMKHRIEQQPFQVEQYEDLRDAKILIFSNYQINEPERRIRIAVINEVVALVSFVP